jgi:hypothetical protein
MTLKQQEERANQLNVVGTPVYVIKGDGKIIESKTRSEPWLMESHSWMVMVEGIAGGYCVTHIQPKS